MVEKWGEKEHRREEIIKRAVEAADRIILEESDGSIEETNYLTARVAEVVMKKALHPFSQALLSKDIQEEEK